MEISPVALEDDAVFQCQVGAVEGVLGIRSRSASFTVQVPPEPPVIVVTHAHSHAQVYKSTENNGNGDEMLVSASGASSSTSNDHHLRTTAGMTIELTCEAHSGRPPAEVSAALLLFQMEVYYEPYQAEMPFHGQFHQSTFTATCFIRKKQ